MLDILEVRHSNGIEKIEMKFIQIIAISYNELRRMKWEKY